jgi:hypothetical protein
MFGSFPRLVPLEFNYSHILTQHRASCAAFVALAF